MTDAMSAAHTIKAPPETVFAVLTDPTTHQAIDGTGWVREPLDAKPLTEVGQVFRMAMYHDNYGGMHYEVANRVEVFQPPDAIAWLPGQAADDARLDFGGWIWRYDLRAVGDDRTEVTLTYDWSAVPPAIRENIVFPPFDPQHLENSLKHLAMLAEVEPGG
ncbi:SRPBCC domain-containing protein [Mycolicibacterium sp. S2-37]|uniref:SRPBCC family protein n=1 Tax=Mycolicibacterium sp. S2-37 TaxID=2810297 RepID=UPI001A93CA5F|nr:SRPBCC family protein [Mycolicibacterium sp. S2-37]MBO0676172.1 SRPBCC domain-containing protein [Mycolicibacterium sp. S2-37]